MSVQDPIQPQPNRRSAERRQADRARRGSEDRQREVLEHGAVGVAYWDLDGRLLFLNDRAVKNLGGTSPEEFLGKSFADLFGDETGGVYLARIRKVADAPEPVEFVECVELPIGRRWLSSVHTRSLDAAGEVVGVHVYAVDITGHKQIEEALREGERRFRAIADYTYDWESWIGTDGRLMWVNPAVERITGYTVSECMEMPDYPAPLFHEDDREVASALLRPGKTEEERTVNDFTLRIRRKDGSTLWVSVSSQPIYDSEGIPLGQRSSIRDITERKQAEAALRDEASWRRIMVGQSRDGIVVLDQNGKVYEANEAYAHMLGYSMEELCQLHVWDWDTQFTKEELQGMLAAIDESGDHFETLHRRRDGTLRKIEISTSGTVYGGEKFVFCVCRDVTEQKRAEQERLALERQLQESQKLESLGVLAGGIAHDFNNILTSVLGNAELALCGLSPSAPARENLLEITQASRRAAALARQMLAYSGKGHFVIEPIDLSAFIEDMFELLRSAVSKKALLHLNLGKDLPLLEGDPSQLSQVIMNLVINASEAVGDESGVITISTGVRECSAEYLHDSYAHVHPSPPGPYLTLEVSDTGCGMDADTQEHLFEPFFTTKFTGRGLGLSAVLGIVRGHKGAVKLTSAPGRGTTFTILFPASDAGTLSPTPRTSTPTADWQGSGTILLVDDEEIVRTMGAQMLSRLGFRILTAADGREALTLYAEHRDEITVVLLDLTMPHMGGEETFRELRILDPEVRVIMSSGYSEQDSISRFTDQTPAGFLQKPYTLVQLRERLRAALED